MKKTNIIILAAAIVLIVAAAAFFLNQNGRADDIIQAPVETPAETPTETENVTGPGEPASADDPDVARPVGTGVGNIAPEFTLKNLEGEDVSLSDYRGKHVFLNFWATWCGYCDQEMPDLQKIYEENDDIVVLAVSVMETQEEVETYVDENGLSFPVVLDEEGMMGSLYLVRGMPTTYFINKEGVILGSIPGMLTFEQMNDVLNQMRELED